MALGKNINPVSRTNNDTGFGTNTNTNNYGGRFINRDGSFNLQKVGRPFWDRYSLYQIMLSLPVWNL